MDLRDLPTVDPLVGGEIQEQVPVAHCLLFKDQEYNSAGCGAVHYGLAGCPWHQGNQQRGHSVGNFQLPQVLCPRERGLL